MRRATTRAASSRGALKARAMAAEPSDFGTSLFDSWGAYVDTAARDEIERMGRSSRDHGDPSFLGTETFEDALKLARDGWKDGAEQLSELAARLEGRLGNVSTVKQPGYSIVGPGVLDMGRYLMGHPEPYMVFRDSEELTDVNPDRVLKVIVCAGANANLSDTEIWWRGAAAIAITDLVESGGARVELELARESAGRYGANGAARHVRRVMVKRAQDHVAPEILAFALAHPSSHRRIDWGVRETLASNVRLAMGSWPAGGYGRSQDLAIADRDGALYVPYHAPEFRSAEGTAAWVVRALKEHGIEVETTR